MQMSKKQLRQHESPYSIHCFCCACFDSQTTGLCSALPSQHLVGTFSFQFLHLRSCNWCYQLEVMLLCTCFRSYLCSSSSFGDVPPSAFIVSFLKGCLMHSFSGSNCHPQGGFSRVSLPRLLFSFCFTAQGLAACLRAWRNLAFPDDIS